MSLKDITCPVYLLAGEEDDITPKEQVFDAEKYLGTLKERIVKTVVPGGHIGLFMGTKTLAENWPGIAEWIGTSHRLKIDAAGAILLTGATGNGSRSRDRRPLDDISVVERMSFVMKNGEVMRQ